MERGTDALCPPELWTLESGIMLSLNVVIKFQFLQYHIIGDSFFLNLKVIYL